MDSLLLRFEGYFKIYLLTFWIRMWLKAIKLSTIIKFVIYNDDFV